MKNLTLVLMLAVSLAACKTNKQANKMASDAQASGYAAGQSDAETKAVKAAAVITALYESYGATSYDFNLVKFGKDNANYAVISYKVGATTQYLAIDVTNFSGNAFDSWAAAHPSQVFVQLTANGDGTYQCAAGCYNGAGSTVTSSMVFEKTMGSMKDLEKAAAAVEALKVENMASNLSAEFGLSQERSLKVAKLAASWEKLSKTRALTNADADAFSRELTGVSIADMENAEKAMINGSASEMSAVLNKAAEVNGTTSENMSAIMMKLFF